ncbi:MAG: hypothetical protein F4X71_04005 [Cenarchaeum sp. SB0662_bin_33]|nr:hypothetical protein [Cenarchaeum sp. SB0662_bin_33]
MTKKNKKLTIMALALVIPIAILLAANPTQNGGSYVLFQGSSEAPENPGDTFVAPPVVGTNAHDEWIEWYRNAEFDGLDSYTRDAALVLHDFEVMFSPDMEHDASWEVVALLAQKERLGDGYAPTTNEGLMHDWIIEQYQPPHTIPEIDAAVLAIVLTEDNFHYAENVYQTMTDVANIGYVPNDLREQDWEYWHWEMHIAVCDLFWEDCDPVQLREDLANNRELTAEEITAIEEYQNNNIRHGAVVTVEYDQSSLPTAYAAGVRVVPKQNAAYLNLWADTCTHQDTIGCQFDDRDNGVGWNRVSESSTNHQDNRGDSPHTSDDIHFMASVSASNTSDVLSQYVYVTGQFTLPNDTTSLSKYGITGAVIQDEWDPSGSDHTYGAAAKTNADNTYED